MKIETISLLILFGLRYGPQAMQAARNLFTKASAEEPTDEDWNKVFATMGKPYDSYIEEAAKEIEGSMIPEPFLPPKP